MPHNVRFFRAPPQLVPRMWLLGCLVMGFTQVFAQSSDDGYSIKALRQLSIVELLNFTENESNAERLYGVPNASPFVKDGIHEYVVNGRPTAVNQDRVGSKAAIHYVRDLAPSETTVIRLRVSSRGDLHLPSPA